MAERSEEQVLTQAPIVVCLGGVKHNIELLKFRESREWKKKLVKAWASLPKALATTIEDTAAFEAALSSFLVDMPDVVVDLFFEYAHGLNREEIEKVATEQELATAWDKVVAVSFPLSRSLITTMERLSR